MAIYKRIFIALFWLSLIGLSCWFYYDNAVAYLFGYRSERFGDTFFNNQIWFVAHIAGTTCSLFLGPTQFWKSFRTKYMRWHRIAGKVYIIGSLMASITAFRLSLLYDCLGCRYGLVILAVFFFFTTALAWYAVLQKNIKAHKQFMVRSYTCALTFVIVRLPQVLPLGFIFSAIDDRMTRRTVQEWIYSFIPLFIVEIVMIWIPSLKSPKRTHLRP